jgi:hypothetical protein
MRMQRNALFRLLPALLLWAATLDLRAQGTAFSYQGQLSVAGALANTNYDFRFAVYDAVTNGTAVSGWITNSAVPVASGLFSVKLDFGAGIFNGTDNGSNDWLDIAVRAVGVTNFTTLTPRQPILPVPYALFATSASNLLGYLQATQLSGTIGSSLVSGTYSNSVDFSNSTNEFAGTFAGIGAGLYNLNGSNISSGTVADARLTTTVALLYRDQVFTSSNVFDGPGIFNGINIFTNWNNSFVGSFFGNGLVGWNAVTSASQQAVRDHGYMETNALFSAIALPTSPLTNGDIVRISGAGTGGWSVTAASGQSIVGSFATYSNCFAIQTAADSSYSSVAATADGVVAFAVGGGVANGFNGIKASVDSGKTFTALTSTAISSLAFLSVACSANGRIVYAEPSSTSDYMEWSTNGGATWVTNTVKATTNTIACTANGQLLTTGYACSGNGSYQARLSGGAILISTSSGSITVTNGLTPSFSCLAVSSDCTRLVAGAYGGLLYASANQGASWTALTATNQYWTGAWMSPDGSKIAASAATVSGINGGLFFSSVTPEPNTTTTSSITGSMGSAVELQYIGNGVFIPVSSSGLIWAN